MNYIEFECEKCGAADWIDEKRLNKRIADVGKYCVDCYRYFKMREGKTDIPNWVILWFRARLSPWVKASFRYHNNKCIITGQKATAIHHIKSLIDIIEETYNELGLTWEETVNDRTQETDTRLIYKCLQIHYRYGHGAALTDELHVEFHKKYGKYKTTPEQFWEFLDSYGVEYDKSKLLFEQGRPMKYWGFWCPPVLKQETQCIAKQLNDNDSEYIRKAVEDRNMKERSIINLGIVRNAEIDKINKAVEERNARYKTLENVTGEEIVKKFMDDPDSFNFPPPEKAITGKIRVVRIPNKPEDKHVMVEPIPKGGKK